MVGVSQAMISLLEAENIIRKKSPRLVLLIKIAEALDVCYNDILHFHCENCNKTSCKKRKYVEDNDKNFYEDNLFYYQ